MTAQGPSTSFHFLARVKDALLRFENVLLALAFLTMTAVPLGDSLFRMAKKGGIPSSSDLLQHLTLFLALFGGAAAAREGRLLSLSTAEMLLHSRWHEKVRLITGSIAAAITLWLVYASFAFVVAEKEAAASSFWGLSSWHVASLLPLGFSFVAFRILWKSASACRGRFGVLVLCLAETALLAVLGPPKGLWVLLFFGILVAATIFGLPIFALLGGAALLLFHQAQIPLAAVPVETYRLVTNPTIPTLPLFTLAGYFLAEGGASRRLLRFFQAAFGWIRGGPALVTALVCAFFTAFTGASGVTILALGGLLFPILQSSGYSEKNILGLLTSCGSLGLLFPPSLPIILYGVVAKTPIDQLFLAGILPGFLLVLLTVALGIRLGPKTSSFAKSFSFAQVRSAAWEAKFELLLPLLILGGLFSGFLTLVETAAFTALYAMLSEFFVHKDLSIRKDFLRITTSCAVLVGGVLLILGVALGLTSYLVDAQIPDRAAAWVRASIHSKILFLLLLNFFLLIVGCLMDIFSAIIVVVPLLLPMGEAFGLHPVHLGILFLANMELGYLTPPVGLNLFLSSYRFQKPLPVVYRSVLPFLWILLFGVLLITYLPALTLSFLPSR